MTDETRQSPTKTVSHDRWAYRCLVLDDNAELNETRLNNCGLTGWELVAIGGRYETQQFAYLKRRTRTAEQLNTLQRPEATK